MQKLKRKKINSTKIARAVKEILSAIGEDLKREGLKETPERVARMYEEIFNGYFQDPKKILKVTYQEEHYNEIILLKDIPIYSICEHHLIPFFGKCHIAYLPRKILTVRVPRMRSIR